MIVKDFIISALKDIVYLFENVQCEYTLDTFDDTHYIRITPSKVFKDSKTLKNYRGQILEKFYNFYPNDSIVFLTEGSTIKLENVEFKIAGSKYIDPTDKIWMSYRPSVSNPKKSFWSDLAGHNNYALAA